MHNTFDKIFTIYFWICKIILYLYMAKKKKTGGRKPVKPSDKVILVGFYTKKSFVDGLGGMEKTREYAKYHIEHLSLIEPE